MGFNSIWHWAILLVIILLVFGTGKLTRVGSDLGNAVRGFKRAMQDGEDEEGYKVQKELQADPPSGGAQVNQNPRESSESK
jgi:sec-independent protein translocase protein TatA